MAESRHNVVVIGDGLIDEIHTDTSVHEFVGGAALNVAVGLAALGGRTTLLAMIGDDAAGQTIRSYLDERGVELIPTIGPNGTSRGISFRRNGEPSYTFNRAAQDRRVNFGPAEREAIAAADLVVVSCFPFDDVEQSHELMDAIAQSGARLILDPNPREGMLHDRERFKEMLEKIAADALLVKIGDDDAHLIWNTSLEEVSDRLLASGTTTLLGTAGRNGAFVETADGTRVDEPIAEMDGPIIDTMGAGDATLASVVDSILTDGQPRTELQWDLVLRRAMLIAAATCRHEGALIQWPEELDPDQAIQASV